jgi:hypothetical protein
MMIVKSAQNTTAPAPVEPTGDDWSFDELDPELQEELRAAEEDLKAGRYVSEEEAMERLRRIAAGE